MYCYLQSSWSSIRLCSHRAYSLVRHPLRYWLPMVPLVIFLFFQEIYQLPDVVAASRSRGCWKTVSLAVVHVPLIFHGPSS